MTLTHLKSAGQVFCRMSFICVLTYVFSWLNWDYRFGGWKPQRWIALLNTPYQEHTMWLITGRINFSSRINSALPDFSAYIKLPFSPFYTLSVGSKSQSPAPTQREENWAPFPGGGVFHIDYLEFFCKICPFSLCIYLFNHDLYQYVLPDIYFILWVIIQYCSYLFCCLNRPSLAIGSSFSSAPLSLWYIIPSLLFLTFWALL